MFATKTERIETCIDWLISAINTTPDRDLKVKCLHNINVLLQERIVLHNHAEEAEMDLINKQKRVDIPSQENPEFKHLYKKLKSKLDNWNITGNKARDAVVKKRAERIVQRKITKMKQFDDISLENKDLGSPRLNDEPVLSVLTFNNHNLSKIDQIWGNILLSKANSTDLDCFLANSLILLRLCSSIGEFEAVLSSDTDLKDFLNETEFAFTTTKTLIKPVEMADFLEKDKNFSSIDSPQAIKALEDLVFNLLQDKSLLPVKQ